MDTMFNPDKFEAPCLPFSALPDGMGEKLEVGDTICAYQEGNEIEATVIEIDKSGKCAYLSKELPQDSDLSVKETATETDAPFDAVKKEAAAKALEDNVLTGPLSSLKKLLISISIEQGDCNE